MFVKNIDSNELAQWLEKETPPILIDVRTVLQFVDKYLITRFGSCFNQAGCFWKIKNRAVLSTGVNSRETPGILTWHQLI